MKPTLNPKAGGTSTQGRQAAKIEVQGQVKSEHQEASRLCFHGFFSVKASERSAVTGYFEP